MKTPAKNDDLRTGFVEMIPLWLGIVPFAIAFSILATTNGFTTIETVALSALVFAGSAQLAFVDLASADAPTVTILLTVLLLNLRHVFYGLTIDMRLPRPRRLPTPLLAGLITDESFGLTVRRLVEGKATDRYLFGASISLYISFVVATVAGALIGDRLPDPERLRLDVVFPLSFLALLVPLLRGRRSLMVAAVAALSSLALREVTGSGTAVLLAIIIAAGAGTLLESEKKPTP